MVAFSIVCAESESESESESEYIGEVGMRKQAT